MRFFSNNNSSIIVLIFSIATLMLCLCVKVSLARNLPHTNSPPPPSLDQNNMFSSSSSSQAFAHSKQGPNSSAHDHQPATVAASLRRIPASRPNPTQNKLRPGIRV